MATYNTIRDKPPQAQFQDLLIQLHNESAIMVCFSILNQFENDVEQYVSRKWAENPLVENAVETGPGKESEKEL